MKKYKKSNKKEIFYSKQYLISYAKRLKHRPAYIKKQLIVAISLFIVNRGDPVLRDHPLSGVMQGKGAFSVTNDIRIIYKETNEYIIFLDIGTHEQVYIN
jgi:mRNA-degrading endonuclease YafQ of YafQ-DinJ toxin-antitoxin module